MGTGAVCAGGQGEPSHGALSDPNVLDKFQSH